VIAARILTACTFIHFLVILAVLGWLNKPKRMPASIPKRADARKGKGQGQRAVGAMQPRPSGDVEAEG